MLTAILTQRTRNKHLGVIDLERNMLLLKVLHTFSNFI